jgi:Sec-independent protein translocase protein TatA
MMSFGELALCGLIAILVLSPERLAMSARVLGRCFGRFNNFKKSLQEEIDNEQAPKDGS